MPQSKHEKEECPYCGESLEYHEDLGYRQARMAHLLYHSIEAALKLPQGTIAHLEDDILWDAAGSVISYEDTWETAAFMVHDAIYDFLEDYVDILLDADEYDKKVAKAVAWVKYRYPSAFDDITFSLKIKFIVLKLFEKIAKLFKVK